MAAILSRPQCAKCCEAQSTEWMFSGHPTQGCLKPWIGKTVWEQRQIDTDILLAAYIEVWTGVFSHDRHEFSAVNCYNFWISRDALNDSLKLCTRRITCIYDLATHNSMHHDECITICQQTLQEKALIKFDHLNKPNCVFTDELTPEGVSLPVMGPS